MQDNAPIYISHATTNYLVSYSIKQLFCIFSFQSESFMAHLDAVAAKCGYTGYVEKHVTFPPKGRLPLPGKSTEADPGCDVWSEIFNAALAVNPAFNVYRIFDTVSPSQSAFSIW